MGTRSIHSRAPTRIDLAGGTVDIWPIYLFLKKPVTINLGIDLFAEATVEITPVTGKEDAQVTLKSDDQNHELKCTWSAFARGENTPPPALELHYKLLQFFYEKKNHGGARFDYNLTLRTKARSPAGAGLGGSSTLSIAMIGALATWANEKQIEPLVDGENFIEIVRDVETTVIHVPAGLQDYYGAMYGGLQSLQWGPGTHHHEWLPSELIPDLEKRLLLFYSGQSRNSGINNWALFKGFIDNQDNIRTQFGLISAATWKLDAALKKRDWVGVGQAIAEEWDVRKTLAKGITTPEIDQAFNEARKIAPISGKVCGAGGGGCFFVYFPTQNDEERTKQMAEVQKIFSDQGMRSLPFRGVPHGLEVNETRT
jgi:D-glycero-alpha-D-manno-heptose-7-phosphate kinase